MQKLACVLQTTQFELMKITSLKDRANLGQSELNEMC